MRFLSCFWPVFASPFQLYFCVSWPCAQKAERPNSTHSPSENVFFQGARLRRLGRKDDNRWSKKASNKWNKLKIIKKQEISAAREGQESWRQEGPKLAHVGASWASLASTWATLAQVSPNLAPTWPNMAPNWPQRGPRPQRDQGPSGVPNLGPGSKF